MILGNQILNLCKYLFEHNELSNYVLSDYVCIIKVISIICSQIMIIKALLHVLEIN